MQHRRIEFAVFIDRDGTINLDVDNLSKTKDLTILPRIPEAIALLNKFQIPVIVVTNQPVIARGLLTEEEVEKIHQEINRRINEIGAKIDAFYFCPHHPKAIIKKYRITCICRKPDVGMYQQAARDFEVDVTQSYVVGDSFRDIEAGNTLGATTIAVGFDQTKLQNSKPNYLVKDLYDGIILLLKKEKFI